MVSRRTRLGRFTALSAALHAAGFTLPFVTVALRVPGCAASGARSGDDDPADVIELVLREEQPTRPDARDEATRPQPPDPQPAAQAGAVPSASRPASSRQQASQPVEARAEERSRHTRPEQGTVQLPVERDPAELLALLRPPDDVASGGSLAPTPERAASGVSAPRAARDGGLATSFETELRVAERGARVGRPEMERAPALAYPAEAVRKREEGVVTVRLLIDARGGVPVAYVKTASRSRALDRTALAYATELQFHPVLDEAGRPMWGWLNLDVRFRLRESGEGPIALGEARRRE